MDLGLPKFRRRAADRPHEIVRAALEVFAERGFAAARLDDIARRAGVSKGALYLYFETKEDLFRAVVERAVAPNLTVIKAMAAAHPGPFADLIRGVAGQFAHAAGSAPLGGVLKMVIGEARNFPQIAKVWHDEVVFHALDAVSQAVRAAQARGEVRSGEARTFALQLIAPLLVAVIWRETFTPVGADAFDLHEVAQQHVETLLTGMLAERVAA